MRDTAGRAELARRVAVLTAENERLRQRAAVTEKIVGRWQDEAANRVKAQLRLDRCARVFAVLSHVYPELRGLITRAREDIWNAD
jgi:hypothetical protein